MWKSLAVVVAVVLLVAAQAAALQNEDLLAAVAMPLAVAAVADAADVPMRDLIDVVTLLNDAQVPPAQFIEVVRYVPVVLVEEPQRVEFVDFLRAEEQRGVRGTALVTSIANQFRTYGLTDANLVVARPRIDITDDYVAPIVAMRTARRASHPHGGPPGQIKKELGVQTGAEVVHGRKPGNQREDAGTRVVGGVVDDDSRRRTAAKPKRRESAATGRGNQPREQRVAEPPGQRRGNAATTRGNRGGKGKGNVGGGGGGNAKGKGGKGKG